MSGHVADGYGRPVTGVPSVSLIRDGSSGTTGSRSSGRLEADGRFVINAVPPGHYIAYASETGAPGRTRFATAEVSVTGERGAFEISGLPASRYLAYAAQAVPRSAWTNLEYLAGLAPAAEPFSLGDGETRHLSLPLRPAP